MSSLYRMLHRAPQWTTVSATGHRPQHLSTAEGQWVRTELAHVVQKLRDAHAMETGISGMAIGADMWWAEELLSAGVRLWAHVPFPQQPDRWPPAERARWRRLLDQAAQVTTYGDAYDVCLLHERNDGMLAYSQAVVAVWKRSKTTGGTASAFRKARRRGLPIVHLDPERRTVSLISAGAAGRRTTDHTAKGD
jgi:uncharacterized phage-like protein YoqJ